MYKLKYCEFYITNVCNLNCQNCNRFNNYAFSGHQRWLDYAEQYRKWADIIDFETIGIIGGEPLLNPEFPTWLDNIASFWPRSTIKVITNGTQVNRWAELYSLIEKYKDRVILEVSIHGIDLRDKIVNDVLSWLQDPIKQEFVYNSTVRKLWKESYAAIKAIDWPDCDAPSDFDHLPDHIKEECINQYNFSRAQWEISFCKSLYTDRNGVRARIHMANYFNESSVIFHDGELKLQNSDPEKSISVCYSKNCHHFINGKLYKCGPVGLLPEFVKQFLYPSIVGLGD
jgi:organic radical activating enzyme